MPKHIGELQQYNLELPHDSLTIEFKTILLNKVFFKVATPAKVNFACWLIV